MSGPALRVLMLTHNVAFKGGGTFFTAQQLGQALARRGHAVTLMASSAAAVLRFGERAVKGIRLVEAPGLLPARWRYGYDFYEAARRAVWILGRSFDIVHGFESRPTVIYPALAAQRRGARLALHWGDWFGRGGSVEQRPNPLARALLRPLETYYEEAFRRRAAATTVINSALEARALSLGVRPETILRLPHVSDPERVRPGDRAEARLALGLPPDAPVLGYVGALFPPDAAMLAEAFRRVRAAQPGARLLLIGVRAEVVVASGLVRVGFVDPEALSPYFAACDVLCLPLTDSLANRGRYPSKLADYFAAGRPVVASAVGDVGPVMEAAQAGLLAEPTAAGFAAQVLALLADADLRERLGRNARRAAETYYNWAALAGQVEQLYLRVMQAHRGD